MSPIDDLQLGHFPINHLSSTCLLSTISLLLYPGRSVSRHLSSVCHAPSCALCLLGLCCFSCDHCKQLEFNDDTNFRLFAGVCIYSKTYNAWTRLTYYIPIWGSLMLTPTIGSMSPELQCIVCPQKKGCQSCTCNLHPGYWLNNPIGVVVAKLIPPISTSLLCRTVYPATNGLGRGAPTSNEFVWRTTGCSTCRNAPTLSRFLGVLWDLN